MKKKLTYFSLFTGAGGLDIGFKEVGFKSLGASDIMDEAELTFQKNWPKEPFIKKDIRKLTASEILKVTNGEKPDVFIGGPPCQGFSLMGDKNSSDPRNKLFEAYVRLVSDLQPLCFVFENVKGLKTMFKGRYLKEVANSFSKIGYDVYLKVLDSSNYGVAQKRERVILVGTRLDKSFHYPKPNNKSIGKLKAMKNVGDAINDLIGKENTFPNHIPLSHNEIVLRRYKLIPEGGKLPPPEELPKEIRRKNFGNTYTRLDRKKVSPTMVPGNNAFPVHPTLDRSLTPREAARIQSFPDNVIFEGNRRMQCIQVGNAVPPLLAANIAKSVKDHIEKKETIDEKEYDNLLLKRNSKMKYDEKDNEKIKFIDLFAGAGGIMIGMQNSGMEPVLSADFDKYVEMTHKFNFPEIPFVHGDLSEESVKKEVLDIIGDQKIDLVVGGPPCQGFSMFGKRRFVNTKDYDPHQDPRNKLVYTFMEYVRNIKPKWFMMENVPGLINMDGGSFLKKLIEEFKEMGYKDLDYKIINTADYGVPQKRKRFILIGNRTGNLIPWPKPKFFENPKAWQKPYRTLGEVITDLMDEESYEKYANHKSPNHSELMKERISYIEEGKKMDLDKLPEHLKIGQNTGKPIKNFSHVYSRLNRKSPTGTLVPGHNAFPLHPVLNRQITIREAARIQTFPDDLIFQGPSMEQCRQVGNAFPALAAEVFGNNFIKAIKNNWEENSVSELVKYSIVEKESLKKEKIPVGVSK